MKTVSQPADKPMPVDSQLHARVTAEALRRIRFSAAVRGIHIGRLVSEMAMEHLPAVTAPSATNEGAA